MSPTDVGGLPQPQRRSIKNPVVGLLIVSFWLMSSLRLLIYALTLLCWRSKPFGSYRLKFCSIKDLELLLSAPGPGKSLGKPLSSLRLPWLHQRFPARGSSNGWSNIMSDGLIFLNNVCPRMYSFF
ncbi:hypothetical protein F2Q69_00031452 [Brassica cretica]|uniref:Uncharacterized protein n=1 Tax=Brassica cretica TaxID=69181 RepID=A0A8S9RWF8_BRACR|nr:hypothetical protein F2Q69_00031452 [Brassica cretica]